MTNFQSFRPCAPEQEFTCSADFEEGWLNLAGETLVGGSSGGPIMRNGEVVGIQQGAINSQTTNNDQEQGVPINLIVEEFGIG